MNILRTIHVILMFLLTIIAFPWTLRHRSYFAPSHFDHFFILFGLWLFNVLRTTQLNEELLEDRELERQATNLDFTSLADATCSNPRDEVRIREAISGFELEVETTIQILMKSGAYNSSLRRAYESGEEIAGKGTTDLVVKTTVATLLWVLCAGHCLAVFVLQDFMDEDASKCFRGNKQSIAIQGQISVALCVSVAMFVPIWTFLLERRGPEQGVFAVWAWTISATYALGIPAVVEIGGFLYQQQLWFISLPFTSHYCPSAFVQFMLIWFPPIIAVATVFLLIGQNSWLWHYVSGRRSGESDSDLDSDLSSTS